MKERTRNISVGLTVIVALMILGSLILIFTGLPWFLQRGYEIKIAADKTYDAHPGDGIHLVGMQIGKVIDIGFTDPEHPYRGVIVTAKIDEDIRLPGNVRAEFYTRGLVGAAYIELKPHGGARTDPATGATLEVFPTDGSIVMDSKHFGESMIPRELVDAVKGLTDLAENINNLISPVPSGAPEAAPAQPTPTRPETRPVEPAGLRETIAKLNRVLDAMWVVLGDEENQRNMKTSLANLTKATAAATDTMDQLKSFAEQARSTAKDFSQLAETSQVRVDELARKVTESADRVSQLMATANRLAMRIEGGEGTAGRLLNDPELYKNLLDATEEMGKLMGEFRLLVEAWRERGVDIRVK